jgi:hypothetical protein
MADVETYSGQAARVVKVSDKVVPVLHKTPRYKDVWASGGIAPTFLTSVLDGGEFST